MDPQADLRAMLQRRGGAYKRSNSTASAPGGLASRQTPSWEVQLEETQEAISAGLRDGLSWLSSFASDPFGQALAPPARPASNWRRGLQAEASFKPPRRAGRRDSEREGACCWRPSKARGQRAASTSDIPKHRQHREADAALRVSFQARGGVAPKVAAKADREVEPFLDSMEADALRRADEQSRADAVASATSPDETQPQPSDDAVMASAEPLEPHGEISRASAAAEEGAASPRRGRAGDEEAPAAGRQSPGRGSGPGPSAAAAAALARRADDDADGDDDRPAVTRRHTVAPGSAGAASWLRGGVAFPAPSAAAPQRPRRHSSVPQLVAATPTSLEAPGSIRASRDFWGKKSIGFASKALAGDRRLSIMEAQAKLQRLPSSPNADLDEVRRIRRLIKELEEAEKAKARKLETEQNNAQVESTPA